MWQFSSVVIARDNQIMVSLLSSATWSPSLSPSPSCHRSRDTTWIAMQSSVSVTIVCVLCDVSTVVYTALLCGSSGCILHWHCSASASDVPHARDLWLLQLLSRIFIIVTIYHFHYKRSHFDKMSQKGGQGRTFVGQDQNMHIASDGQ